KAGVMRAGQPVVCTDRNMPPSVSEYAARVGARLLHIDDAFTMDGDCWHGTTGQVIEWPEPLPASVLADNLAGALAVVEQLGEPADSAAMVTRACHTAAETLHGRREIVEDRGIRTIYDVGHNVEAIAVLAAWLRNHPVTGVTHVVIGMLAD